MIFALGAKKIEGWGRIRIKFFFLSGGVKIVLFRKERIIFPSPPLRRIGNANSKFKISKYFRHFAYPADALVIKTDRQTEKQTESKTDRKTDRISNREAPLLKLIPALSLILCMYRVVD